ncbi:hypothetical protein F4824DRAFT_227903 [Ustulina deusta]|nr:hypothetical protein F4824DRAFT_227903 [Ustulina deusta]
MLRVVCRRQPKQFDPVTPGALRDVKIPMYVMFYDRFSNKIMYFISYACADMLSRRFALRVSRSDKRSNFLPSLTYSQALKCLSIPSSPTSPQNLPSRPSIKTASVHQDPSRIESKRTLDFIAPKSKTIHHPPTSNTPESTKPGIDRQNVSSIKHPSLLDPASRASRGEITLLHQQLSRRRRRHRIDCVRGTQPGIPASTSVDAAGSSVSRRRSSRRVCD